jgi:alkylated DNA repair dioxygenase AlkB
MNNLAKIKGLQYIPKYISSEEAAFFWQAIYAENWLGDLKRRVQHYGFKYNYKARFIDYSMKIGNLPDWIMPFANRLHTEGYMPQVPDQLIVNEYQAGQGIASHVDCEPCFGNTIISLSLGSACVMDFTHKESQEKIPVLLEPQSLVVLKEDARYLWTHGIAAKKSDRLGENVYKRDVRISLTFRNIIVKSCDSKK